MQAKAYLPLFKEAYNEWSEDKASRLAAALAYYTAVSIAPLLVLAVTILGWLDFDGRRAVEEQMGMFMGSTGQEAARTMIDAAKQSSGFWPTLISLAILLFGASGVFAELQDSLNTIWEVQPDPRAGIWDTIKKRFLSMAMVFGVIFILLVSLLISTALGAMVTRFAAKGGIVGLVVDTVSDVLNIANDAIAVPPELTTAGGSACITGIGKLDDRIVMLLDTSRLVGGSTLEQVPAA